MFDKREVASKALLRAEEIVTEKRRMRIRAGKVLALFCVCILISVVVALYQPKISFSPEILITDNQIPLAESED